MVSNILTIILEGCKYIVIFSVILQVLYIITKEECIRNISLRLGKHRIISRIYGIIFFIGIVYLFLTN